MATNKLQFSAGEDLQWQLPFFLKAYVNVNKAMISNIQLLYCKLVFYA